MITLADKVEQVSATDVHFQGDILIVSLTDGRQVSLPLAHYKMLDWLRRATHAQREHWTLEPGGFAIYWDDLDDGVEVTHLLSLQPLA